LLNLRTFDKYRLLLDDKSVHTRSHSIQFHTVFDLPGGWGLRGHCMRTTFPLELVWGVGFDPQKSSRKNWTKRGVQKISVRFARRLFAS